jgi:CDGSH-type Zn-finger protein
MEKETIKVVVLPKGPVLMEGSFEITHASGEVENKEGKLAICRCGYSKNKPFCDGAHKDCPSTEQL